MAEVATVQVPETNDYGPYSAIVNEQLSASSAVPNIASTTVTEDFGPYTDIVNPIARITPATNAAVADQATVNIEDYGPYSEIIAGPVPETAKALSEIPNIVALRTGQIKTASEYPSSWIDNASAAANETALDFVPKSPGDVFSMLSPLPGATEETRKIYRSMQDWLGGKAIDEATKSNFPESQILVEANKTPPFSKERFKAVFGILAQIGMLAAGVRGLTKGGEINALQKSSASSEISRVIETGQDQPISGSGVGLSQQGSEVTGTAAPAQDVNAPATETAPAGAVGLGTTAIQKSLDKTRNLPGSYTQELVNLSSDIKAERTAQQREALRQDFVNAYNRKPWAMSLAYGDLEKVMGDLDKGRVTESELWNAADKGRNSGTLDPRIAVNLYDKLAARKSTARPEVSTTAQPAPEGGDISTTAAAPLDVGGAAVPAVTSTKNAVTAAEREVRGIAPAEQAARRDFGTVWDEATNEASKDPTAPQRLVETLKDNPRAVTDKENALLLRRQIEVQNEHNAAIKSVNEAKDEASQVDAQARLERAREAVQASYDVSKVVGTETARGLNARKMLAADDFTLAKMEAETRAVVNKGKPLSTKQAATVKALHDRITAAEAKVAAYEAKEQFEAALKEAKAASKTQGFQPQSFLEQQAVRARERIVARRGQLRVTVDPLNIAGLTDEAIIGASHIARGVTKFADWSAQMLSEFGERIKPHLQALFARAKALHGEAANRGASTQEQRLENALAGDKKRIQTNIEKIQAKTEAKDFTKREKPPARMDKEKAGLLFEYQKAKDAYHRGLIEAQLRDRSVPKKILGGVSETFNTTRALMTSFDLSAVLRQGGFVAMGHPIRALKSFPAMFRALASEKGQFRVEQEIKNRPNAPLYMQSKLYLAQEGPGVSLSKMEEAYMSRWATKIPGIAASGRAYTTFLNKLRADSFDAMITTLTKNGKPTLEESRAIANFVNVATGRGNMGQHATAAATLNKLFFAPRYVLSRFQLLTGQPLTHGTVRTKVLVAGEYAKALIGLGVVGSLGLAAGGTIETDSRSSDFGKIRFGDTRLDLLFGLAQSTVLLSRLATGQKKTVGGKIVPIRGQDVKYGGANSFDITTDFLRTKLAPIPGAAVNLLTGKDAAGQPVTPTSTAQNLLLPISFGDIYKAMQEQGVPAGTAFGLLSTFGMGLQTYPARTDNGQNQARSEALNRLYQ